MTFVYLNAIKKSPLTVCKCSRCKRSLTFQEGEMRQAGSMADSSGLTEHYYEAICPVCENLIKYTVSNKRPLWKRLFSR